MADPNIQVKIPHLGANVKATTAWIHFTTMAENYCWVCSSRCTESIEPVSLEEVAHIACQKYLSQPLLGSAIVGPNPNYCQSPDCCRPHGSTPLIARLSHLELRRRDCKAKLSKPRCQKDVRKYFFSHRVIDRWNAYQPVTKHFVCCCYFLNNCVSTMAMYIHWL